MMESSMKSSMKIFWKLFKIDFINTFSLNRLNKKHGKRTSMTPLIMMSLIYFFLFIMIFFYIFIIAASLKEMGVMDLLLHFGLLVAILICLIFTISQANNVLFESKDFDLLMAMPIKPKIIVASKIASMSLINYLMFGMLFIPITIAYYFYAQPSLLFFLNALIVFIFGPLLIIVICSFISFLMGLLLKKTKYKSMINSLIAMCILAAFLVGYMMFMNNIESITADDLSNAVNITKYIYYPNSLAVSGMLGDYLSLLFYVGLSIIPFGLFIVFIGKNYSKANMRAKISHTKRNYQLDAQKSKSPIKSLLFKETKRFFSSSTYTMNVMVGPLLAVIGTIILWISLKSIQDTLEGEGFAMSLLTLLYMVLSSFSYGIAPSTASSISMEGKTFWILKASPIKTKDIFIAKILFYVLLTSPFIIINGIFLSIVLDVTIFEKVLMFITPFIFSTIYAMEGLWINILTPKFDWTNETKAIKQSAGTIYAMLLGMGISVIMYVPSFIVNGLGGNGLLALLIMSIVGFGIMLLILIKHGKKKYEKIAF